MSEGVAWCTYCGRVADTVDHVVPRHLLKRAAEIGYSPGNRALVVPCCRECNSMLGGRIFATLAERRKAAKAGIRRKYAKALRVPQWAEDELRELSDVLQREVRVWLAVKEETIARLAWTNPRHQERDAEMLGRMYGELISLVGSRYESGSDGESHGHVG